MKSFSIEKESPDQDYDYGLPVRRMKGMCSQSVKFVGCSHVREMRASMKGIEKAKSHYASKEKKLTISCKSCQSQALHCRRKVRFDDRLTTIFGGKGFTMALMVYNAMLSDAVASLGILYHSMIAREGFQKVCKEVQSLSREQRCNILHSQASKSRQDKTSTLTLNVRFTQGSEKVSVSGSPILTSERSPLSRRPN